MFVPVPQERPTDPPERERYVRVDDVADYLGMSTRWVLNRTRRVDDPLPHRKFGRSVRFLLDEVDEWAKRQY
jgi:excisionase family DNA binding protein